MNYLYYLLFSFCFLFSNAIIAQKNFIQGTLGLSNGEKLECEFVLKIKNGKDRELNKDHKRIKYRMPGSEEIKKMDFTELKYILVDSEETKIFLVRMPYYAIRKKNKIIKTNFDVWCRYRGGCEDIKSYLVVHEFEVDKDGQIWESYTDAMGSFLVQRQGEDAPTKVGYVFLGKIITQKAFDKQMRKRLGIYFKGDDHAMSFLEGKKRIKQKELQDYIISRCKN